MDYSLLVGIHNVDQACQEQANEDEGAGAKGQVQKALYSTAIEAIQAEVGRMGSMETEDRWVTECLWSYRAGFVPPVSVWEELQKTKGVFVCRTGGIPARNLKGERLLVYIGIIDILQSYR